MKPKLVKIESGDATVLTNLMSLYLHDMSEYADFLKLGADGTYEYKNLHLYWERDALSAFLIKSESDIAGFILSNRKPYIPDDCEISIQEFFILKKYRGKGWGKDAALEFFRLFPGRYFIAQLTNNKPAIEFWRSVYRDLDIDYDEREEVESGIRVLTQRFDIRETGESS